MISIAIKMLIHNKTAFIGVIFGIFLATLLISQQSAIFLGLVSRSYRLVNDISQPNIWIIDPATHGEDLIRPMPKEYLELVKNIPNIEWAVPINYQELPLSTPSGIYKMSAVYGIDDQMFIGAPHLLEGSVQDLHREGGVIIDSNSARDGAAIKNPDSNKIGAKLGDALEINGQRAVVVGIGTITPGFFPEPIIFTLRSQFQKFSGSDRIQYIAASTRKGAKVSDVLNQINSHPQILGLTSDELKSRMAHHFLKTGILINFGLSVILGLIIGFSITGQIFYMMTMHNIHAFALIKAIGGTNKTILFMVLAQAGLVGIIGYILGTAATLLWGFTIKGTTLAFEFPGELLLLTSFFALIIYIFTAGISLRRLFKLDPQMLMNP